MRSHPILRLSPPSLDASGISVLRVGLDMQLAQGTATGIGEYARGLFAALGALQRPELELVALAAKRLDPWRFDRRVLWDQIGLPLQAARARVGLMHALSGTLPMVSPAPCVLTVHDVAWLRVAAHARAYARAYFGAFALRAYRRARAIFVDSQFSRAELLTFAPELEGVPLIVAYPGVARDVCSIVRMPRGPSYVLAVGTVESRKNLEVIVRALAAIPELRLVSVGPPTPYAQRVRAIARDCGVEDRVELRGYVTRTDLLALYAGAAVAVAPSRYEGFGYAAAQALCAGVPLLAARASALPEVVGDAAPLIDADDVAGWIDALREVLRDQDRATARAHGVRAAATARFAWPATAEIVARAYADAMRA